MICRLATVSAILMAMMPSVAPAQDCRVVVLRPITDDIGNKWKPGAILPVDIERDTGTGGAYCAHGGSCLPRSIGGAAAVRLLSCHTGPSIGGGDHRLVRGIPAHR